MENLFTEFPDQTKKRLVESWKGMNESEKTHFINQVSLALSIWGSDNQGKTAIVEVLRTMVLDGSNNLSDFGLYVDDLLEKKSSVETDKVKRAANIIDNYRMKNALPSEPHKEIGI